MTALGHSRPSFATDPSKQQFRLRPLCCRKRKQIQGYTVARCVRYAAPVVTNEPIEDRPALGELPERTDLIGAHWAVGLAVIAVSLEAPWLTPLISVGFRLILHSA